MDKETALAILTQNTKTYNAIGKAFSATRNYLWPALFEAKTYLQNGMKILDIGCGNGRMTTLLEEYENIFYKGIDVSETFIIESRKTRKDSENVKFEVSDILELKEEFVFYDMVFCIAVLNHIPSKKLQFQALENIYQVLKPGGILFMTNWNLWNPKNKKSVWRSQKYGGFRECKTFWTVDDASYPLYYYAFTKGELQRMLEKLGFTILQSKYKDGNILSIVKK